MKHDISPELFNLISDIFGKDRGQMIEVFWCESRLRQFDSKGKVLVGISGDLGIAQISPAHWWKKSVEMGIDITTLEGNITFAKFILDTQGLNAWSASKKCWQSE